MKKYLLLSFFVLALSCAAFGQSLVKDLSAGNQNTFITGMGGLNGKVCFIATETTSGGSMVTSLYMSDGTDAGTVKIKTGLNSYLYNGASPFFMNVNGKLVFYAGEDGGANTGLWSTDGTEAGTVFLGGSAPQASAPLNNMVLFLSYGDLWKTDGTAAGTVKLAEVKGNSGAPNMVAAGGKVFFQANVGTGLQLWTSDGTTAGTKLLKDMDPANTISFQFLENFITFKGKVYFMGYNPKIYRRCVAVSDGTEAGTDWAFTDLYIWWINANSTKMFMFEGGNGNNFWVTDGTTSGTTKITSTEQYSNTAVSYVANELLYMMGGRSSNMKIMRTDGTDAGTFAIKDSLKAFPGVNFYGAANNKLYFSASTTAFGSELYSTDGTKENTTLIKDINPGKNDGVGPGMLTGGNIYFQGNDGVTGQELWKYQVGTSDVAESSVKPLKYHLSQNYPNPFNPSTKISYTIPENGFVSVKIYNILGNEIATLVSGYKNAGSYNVQFNAKDLPSGIYLCRIEANNFTQTRKLTLMK